VLTITEQRPVKVPVTVISMRWCGTLQSDSVAAKFRCSGCGSTLGARRFGAAMVVYKGTQRSLRLCEDCAEKAEQDIQAQPQELVL
jgi:hypothetical protein